MLGFNKKFLENTTEIPLSIFRYPEAMTTDFRAI
jgi:hypothetical protein